MNKCTRNIYQTARLMHGIEQKSASKSLFCDNATLRGYENGRRLPSDEMVTKMTILYDAKWLSYMHLRQTPIGRLVLPEIRIDLGFAASVLILHRTVNDLVAAMNELMEVAEEDYLNNGKEEIFNSLRDCIEATVSACMTILANDHKKKNGQRCHADHSKCEK